MEKAKENQSIEFPIADVKVLQNQSECPPSTFNWKALKSISGGLKIGQIITGLIVITITRSRGGMTVAPQSYDGFPELPFVFFATNVTVLTFLMLTDSVLVDRPLRKAFTPKLWFRVELWFTGLTALGFHLLSYAVLTATYYYYHVEINRVSSGNGFVAAALYAVDWWMNFARRQQVQRDLEEEDAAPQEGSIAN